MLVPIPIDTKALAEATKLGKPIVDTACELIKALLGEPCRVAGNMLADQVYAWQWSNRLRIMEKAAVRMRRLGIPAASMPAGFLIPVLDAIGNAEDETLQDIWARLIANAAQTSASQHPMFIDVLKRWSSDDARLFERVCRNCDMLDDATWATGNSGPWSPNFDELNLLPSIARLQATGILVWDGHSTNAAGVSVPIVGVTLFARQLFQALSEPTPAPVGH